MEIRIKHLIQYLSEFDPETKVILDKDGWLEDEIEPEDELDLIDQRGCFSLGKNYFCINN